MYSRTLAVALASWRESNQGVRGDAVQRDRWPFLHHVKGDFDARLQLVGPIRVERPPLPIPPAPNDDTGVGPAPPETVTLRLTLVAMMAPDERANFEERTFHQRDRASLWELRRAIERRRNDLAG